MDIFIDLLVELASYFIKFTNIVSYFMNGGMIVKFKKCMAVIIVFMIFIGYKIYALKTNNVIHKGYDYSVTTFIKDDENNLSIEKGKTDDIEEPETIFTFNPLSEEIKDKILGISFKENNNIKIEDLAYIQVTYWGFDDKEHVGELIVNKVVSEDVIEIFKELYEAKFPIEKIRLIDDYNANDELSMLDNNTSAFCYREIVGSKKISNHGYGVAIDINPVQNPYVKNNIVSPESGREYLDRENIRKGMIIKGDNCYNAFISRGWEWGGEWKSLKDYQHFEFKIPNN